MTWLKSLRARLAVGSAALFLVALVAVGLLVYVSVAETLYASLDDSLRLSASQAVGEIDTQNGKIVSNGALLNGTLTVDILEHELTIRIIDQHGKNLQAIGPDRDNPIPPDAFATVADGETDLRTVSDSDSPYPLRIYMAPISDNGVFAGAVMVVRPLTDVQLTLNRIRLVLLIVIPFLVLLVGFGVYLLTAWALRPINQVIFAARQVSTYGLPIQINLPTGGDEVGQLVETLKVMMARLEESFYRERQFTADASHELRTPLTAMQTIIQTTLDKPHNCQDTDSALHDLADETNRLQRLTQNLLLLDRSDLIRHGIHRPVNLSLLLTDVADSMRSAAEKKGLILQQDIADDLLLSGDRDALIRLFVNLIDNAIKYTSTGIILICAEITPDRPGLIVTVKDTGSGISAEHLPFIFERFYRGAASRTATGSGLGLTIAREIVKAHQGKIEVSSLIGEGTTFLVYLPAKN